MPMSWSGVSDPIAGGKSTLGDEILDICAELRRAIPPQAGESIVLPEPNPRRDQLLRDYHRAVLAHIRHDAQFNLLELKTLVRETSDRCGSDLSKTPMGTKILARLDDSLACVARLDPYRDGKTELQWWLALHQFYLDGLYLADRLLAARGREWERHRSHRRVEFLGLSALGTVQALVTALEVAVPHLFRVNPWDTYLPTLLHLLAHHVFPGKKVRFTDLLATTLGWIHRGGFSRLRGLKCPTVRFAGLEHLHNAELFDLDT